MTHEELFMKAREAASAEELLALAKQNDVPMDEASAAAYYAQMHKTGELADDELDNIAGGACHNGGEMVTTVGNSCSHYTCKHCGKTWGYYQSPAHTHNCKGGSPVLFNCNNSKYCHYDRALWLCSHPANAG